MEQHGRQIGIMGGTFDPIHIGHLMLAQHAKEQFSLDTVWLMPNGTPAYKSDHRVTDVKTRVEMTRIAIQNNPDFELSMIEAEREGNTYTYETLEYLKAHHPENTYYFIIGADSLFSFEQWVEPRKIASNCVLLIANREQRTQAQLEAKIAQLEQQYGADIRILDCPAIGISSAAIRQRVLQGKSIRYYVPDDVFDYISERKLYVEALV